MPAIIQPTITDDIADIIKNFFVSLNVIAPYKSVKNIRLINKTKMDKPAEPVSAAVCPQIVCAGTRVLNAAGSLPK